MGCTNPGHSMNTVCEAAAASVGVYIYNTMLFIYIYCVYALCMHKCKEHLCQGDKIHSSVAQYALQHHTKHPKHT